ncbi:PLP-dependent aminotransferase family protein [Comamonas sp.]|uniref:MocR-like pyridoxine biosynthesis transcription factor PdxR n=1 Tax=Comamonas sp. TaxID=34028 RepID=UPI0028A1700F|nr:PLP-dependent aminotransferase family protein [Comamonas sp.]
MAENVLSNAAPTPQATPPNIVDFVYGPLSARDFPSDAWMRALRAGERQKGEQLSYIDPRGDLALRQELQTHLGKTRGLSCTLDQILIVNGSQQALDLCGRLLVDPGDKVVVESPGYLMAQKVFESYGGHLEFIDVDEHGLKTSTLSRISSAQLVYVTPTHQFPLGGFLPLGRRHELLSWAERSGAWVVEDDYDSEYRYSIRPEDTLYSLNESRVIHVGTFSKTLSPQMRLGYMVLPRPLIGVFVEAKRLADRHSSIASQQALAKLLQDGTYARHIRRLRRVQQSRQRALLHALKIHFEGQIRVESAASGLHIVVWFNNVPSGQESELMATALEHGVKLYPISPLYRQSRQTPNRTAGAVVGYALLEPQEITAGIAKLANALAQFGNADSQATKSGLEKNR